MSDLFDAVGDPYTRASMRASTYRPSGRATTLSLSGRAKKRKPKSAPVRISLSTTARRGRSLSASDDDVDVAALAKRNSRPQSDLEQVLDLLADQGIKLPGDTDESNLLENLKVALHAVGHKKSHEKSQAVALSLASDQEPAGLSPKEIAKLAHAHSRGGAK